LVINGFNDLLAKWKPKRIPLLYGSMKLIAENWYHVGCDIRYVL